MTNIKIIRLNNFKDKTGYPLLVHTLLATDTVHYIEFTPCLFVTSS